MEFWEPVLAPLCKALFEIVLKLFPIGKGSGKEYRDDCKKYLNDLSVALNKIVDSLEKDKVPTGMGTQVRNTLKTFSDKTKKLKVSKEIKDEIEELQDKIYRCLSDGKFLDMIIEGEILRSSLTSEERKRILDDMRRTSNGIKGYANAL